MSRGPNEKLKGRALATLSGYGIETNKEARGNGMIMRAPRRQRRKENMLDLRARSKLSSVSSCKMLR